MIFNYVSDTRSQVDIQQFKKMINYLNEGKNICDKDVILSLYYSLYTIIISPIEIINKNVAIEYSDYFNKTMDTVIRLSKARKDMVTVESFIGNFFYYLSSGDLSKVSPICDMIDLIKNDLDTFISVEKDIFNNFLLVDKRFNLEERLAIAIQYKNYISDLYIKITSIYGVKSSNNMLEDLRNTLDLVFPEILAISNNMDRFDGEIRSYTKDKLKEIAIANKFDFYGESNQFVYNLMQLLNDDEIKVFKLYYLYKLALFEIKDFITMEINDENMALELGIDKESFNKIFKNIARKSKVMYLKQSMGFGKIRKKNK